MRLICPNCDAQYEVPTDVIPEGGRDVQCSNCGHTWFQRHPDDLEGAEAAADADWSEAEAQEEAREEEAEARQAEPAPPSPPPGAARARGIDPEVAEVLREERELERRRRADAQGQSLESQPDLGLEAPGDIEKARREREARERMARMRGEATESPAPVVQKRAPARAAAEAAAAAAAGSRRELLPDVEEINQTLRAASEPRAVDEAERYEAPDRRRGGGFGRGFMLVVLLAALAFAAYVFAPQIGETVPAAVPALETYVAQVDAARVWVDGQITRLLTTLDGMSSESAPEAPPAAGTATETGSGG